MSTESSHRTRRVGTGLIMMLLPILMIIGFGMHPNLLNLSIMTDAADMMAEFHNSFIWQIAHLLMVIAVPMIIVATLGLTALIREKAGWAALVGGSLAVIGCCVLALDKGAFCMVPSAMETLSEDAFMNMAPLLQALLERRGMMAIVWLLPLISVGLIVVSAGLIRARAVPKWQAISLIIGLALLINPDIDIISLAGSVFLLAGLLPIGLGFVRGEYDYPK